MNSRHLTLDEKQMIRKLVDDAGGVEVLRCIACIIGNDHEDLRVGSELKSDVLNVANRLAGNR